jgi:ParB family chromosome partitioning protein
MFDEEAIETLSNSIKLHGVLQPILVRPKGEGRFEIVAGERRWIAARRAGLDTIPAHIRDVDDSALLETALVENIQRQDLNPIEEALAYRKLLSDLSLTQVEVALRVGKDRSSVANCLRLLALPESTQRLVAKGEISEGHGRTLLQLKGPTEIERMAQAIIDEGLSVREVEGRVRTASDEHPSGGLRAARRRTREVRAASGEAVAPELRSMLDELTARLSTKVHIGLKGDHSGELRVEFYSAGDLNRITDVILGH